MSVEPTLNLLDSVLNAERSRAEVGIAVLKKAQDLAQQQGEAIIEVLEKAGSTSSAPLLDTYA